MKSMCREEPDKFTCTAKERKAQKYCKHSCVDEVHPFCAYGYPGDFCNNPDAKKEAVASKQLI